MAGQHGQGAYAEEEGEAEHNQLSQLICGGTLEYASKHESGGLSQPPVLRRRVLVDVGLRFHKGNRLSHIAGCKLQQDTPHRKLLLCLALLRSVVTIR